MVIQHNGENRRLRCYHVTHAGNPLRGLVYVENGSAGTIL